MSTADVLTTGTSLDVVDIAAATPSSPSSCTTNQQLTQAVAATMQLASDEFGVATTLRVATAILNEHHHQDDAAPSGDEQVVDVLDKYFTRHEFLRKMRQLELEDEAERLLEQQQQEEQDDTAQPQDCIELVGGRRRLLNYAAYLAHQRYYDDLKHIDYHYIDYSNNDDVGTLVIEQDKSLGKGGFCWDAAYILADYVVQNKQLFVGKNIVELGTGTGLCGLYVAKAIEDCVVSVTDLPELMPLLRRNIKRNFEDDKILDQETRHFDLEPDKALAAALFDDKAARQSKGSVSAFVLEWGISASTTQTFDCILGADVVASLYDPVALARTIHRLAHAETTVLISMRERLDSILSEFEAEIRNLFDVDIVRPASRNRNPSVKVLVATGKKLMSPS